MSERDGLRVSDESAATAAVADADGDPFLCLHGLADTLEIWDPLVPFLRDRGRVVRFDQRGHGESAAPPGPYSRESLADDAIAVLDSCGIERAVFVAHSMGGVVAMTAALAHAGRVAGLVLLATTGECNAKTAKWYDELAWTTEREGLEGLAAAIYGPRSKRPIAGNAQGMAHVTRMLASLHATPLTPRLSEVRCPALVLVGERDPMGTKPSEKIRDALLRVTFHRLPGVGHWSQCDAPERIAAALDNWSEGEHP